MPAENHKPLARFGAPGILGLTFIWRLGGAMDLNVEVSEVVFVGDSADARHTGIHEGQPRPCS